MNENKKIDILDSTLRDGAQGEGISFSIQDKIHIVEALDELGGNDERKSLIKRIKKLSEKNESLKQKLSEKNKQYDEVYRMYKMVSKKKNVLKNTLLYVKAHINKMLALVDIPALKLLSQRIIKDVNLVEHTNCVYEEVQ